MAQRRMFSPDIVCSDAFLDMSATARDLYYQLCIQADDDGFVNPRKIMRMIGSSEDDLNLLKVKRFVLAFKTGVVVIKHWLIHNLIRADLYKETLYKNEKKLIGLNDNGAYTELREGISEIKKIEPPEWLIKRRNNQRTVCVPSTALRIGKDRLGKDRKEHTDTDEIKPIKEKKSYGELEHVKLTEEEYSKLLSKLGENSTIELIFELDTYIGSKGVKYKSHYATLLNWAKMKHDKKQKQ